jgi:hypothetical protein
VEGEWELDREGARGEQKQLNGLAWFGLDSLGWSLTLSLTLILDLFEFLDLQ